MKRLLACSFALVITVWLQAQDSTKVAPKVGKLYVVPLPALASNPAFGFIYGAAMSSSIFLGDPATTRLSSGMTTATFSTKKQLVFTFKTQIYTRENRWFMMGDWRLLFSSQPTYGLGTGPQSEILVSEDSGSDFDLGSYDDGVDDGELLEFNLLRLHQTAIRQLKPYFFVGPGYHFDRWWNINDVLLDLNSDPRRITNHYAHSVLHGFDPEQYTTSGPSVNVVFDSRDNVNSPYEGRFAFMQFRYQPTWLGSTRNATSIWMEYRDYFGVSKRVKRNLIGIWSFVNIMTSGQLPYMSLPASGWDQLGRSARAYPQGRWRGNSMFYAETEYRTRLKVLNKYPDILGAVVFANVTSTAAEDLGQGLFDYFQPGFGVGLRLMVQQTARSNVAIDYGIGADGKGAFYFNINEYF